jgi:hypothetical protein
MPHSMPSLLTASQKHESGMQLAAARLVGQGTNSAPCGIAMPFSPFGHDGRL